MASFKEFGDRLQHAWNAFRGRDHPITVNYGSGSSYRPDRRFMRRAADRSIVTAIMNRIAIDVSAVDMHHVRLDQNGRYMEDVKSGLNQCLTVEANLDQSGRAFIQDGVMSMLDEGVVALVPIDTNIAPDNGNVFDVFSIRVAKIKEWRPNNVLVEVYNERTGRKEDITFFKRDVGIIENPLYSIMNEPNSTLQRLIHKLNLLDSIDEQSSAGKLDLIIQLPYVVKTEARRAEAEKRRKEIEMQLSNTKYGIAYTDGTEKITQLNRPLENNLLTQIEYLTKMLYSQLGLTEEVFNGTADEKTMLNYYNRTVKPILDAFVEEIKRKFLSKTARTQGQSIMYFNDPFKLVPVEKMADIADKFTRNEIMTSNELRQVIGLKPSKDPKADELRNSNLNHPDENGMPPEGTDPNMDPNMQPSTEQDPMAASPQPPPGTPFMDMPIDSYF